MEALIQVKIDADPFESCSWTSVADPHHFDPDPNPASDSACYFEADPFDADPDPTFQTKAQNLEKGSNRLIFYTLWLVISIDADPECIHMFIKTEYFWPFWIKYKKVPCCTPSENVPCYKGATLLLPVLRRRGGAEHPPPMRRLSFTEEPPTEPAPMEEC